MRYRRLDSNGDMVFGNGIADFHADSPEAVAQAIKTRLRLWRGDWFVDIEEGTPWREAALGEGRLKTADYAIRERILGTQGVSGGLSYESSFSEVKRQLSVRASVDTIFGRARVEEALGWTT